MLRAGGESAFIVLVGAGAFGLVAVAIEPAGDVH
jgi:hypothetical protein